MLETGSRLGTYEILGPLGAGGMGEVYRARDVRLGREVAVKVLPHDVSADPARMARFEHEARAASSLNHPNIVTLHDVGREGAVAYQVLELVAGRTLAELLTSGPLPLRRALQLGEQIAAGLAAAHAAGIVHRDLKPANVMVRDDGVVKLLDFGLAKLERGRSDSRSIAATATQATSPGMVLGTAGYMSPEQARGDPVDYRSDQFSLGSTLYEMVTGQRPFRGDSAAQTLAAIIERDPEPVARLRPDVPRPLGWILERCLAKEPAERYASTHDLAADLRRIREELSEVSTRPAPAGSAPRATASRFVLPLACALAGLAVGALAMVGWMRGEAPRTSADPPTLRTLTFSGQDYLPAASPDGSLLALVSERDGVPRIWLKSLKDGSEAPLTAGRDSRPRFSPDGSMVLFARMESDSTSLYRVPVLGGEPRKVVHDASDADFSPDGERIVFLRTGAKDGFVATAIGTVRVDGGDERILTTVTQGALASPRWSPDGKRIAISASQYGLSESAGKFVLLLDADGSGSKRLLPPVEGGDVSGVAWLGNGDSIVYAQGESVSTVTLSATLINAGASRILRQNVETGAAQVVLWTPSLASQLEVVAPGHIVFDSMLGRQNLEEFTIGDAPAGSGRVLAAGTSVDRQPVYSPDGEWVAFSSNRSGNLDIWARSLRTDELRRLTDHPADDWDPAYTRDGRQLVWTSRRGGNFEIWMASIDGSGARQVTRDGRDAENGTATPDGQWLVYNSGHPEQAGIWKVRTDGTEATRLAAGTYGWPEVSPDGRWASYSHIGRVDRPEIRFIRLADGHVDPLRIELPRRAGVSGRTRWLPDGSIAFTHNVHDRPGIYRQEFRPDADTSATRKPLVVLQPGAFAETFGISPDGKRLTLSASYRSFALMSSENVPGIEPPRRARAGSGS